MYSSFLTLRGGTTKQSQTKTDCRAIARNDGAMSIRAESRTRQRLLERFV